MSSEGRRSRRRFRALAIAVLLAALPAGPNAKVLVTVDEALHLAFPGCVAERKSVFLTPAQLDRARGLAGVEISGALATRWVARREGALEGYGYLDTHRVRTLPESLLVLLDAQGAVRRVEVVSFNEPEPYLPRAAWYRQFEGKAAAPEVAARGAIRPVTGATLSARAATDAVRRVLAIHQAITERPAP